MEPDDVRAFVTREIESIKRRTRAAEEALVEGDFEAVKFQVGEIIECAKSARNDLVSAGVREEA